MRSCSCTFALDLNLHQAEMWTSQRIKALNWWRAVGCNTAASCEMLNGDKPGRFCCRTKWRVRGPSQLGKTGNLALLPVVIWKMNWTQDFPVLSVYWSGTRKTQRQEKCMKCIATLHAWWITRILGAYIWPFCSIWNFPLERKKWTIAMSSCLDGFTLHPEPGWLSCHWFPCRGTLDISTCFTRSRRKRISRMRRKWRMRRLGTCGYSLDFFRVMESSLLQLLVLSWSVRLVASDAYHGHGNSSIICKLIKESFPVVGLSW